MDFLLALYHATASGLGFICDLIVAAALGVAWAFGLIDPHHPAFITALIFVTVVGVLFAIWRYNEMEKQRLDSAIAESNKKHRATQAKYLKEMRLAAAGKPTTIPVPWTREAAQTLAMSVAEQKLRPVPIEMTRVAGTPSVLATSKQVIENMAKAQANLKAERREDTGDRRRRQDAQREEAQARRDAVDEEWRQSRARAAEQGQNTVITPLAFAPDCHRTNHLPETTRCAEPAHSYAPSYTGCSSSSIGSSDSNPSSDGGCSSCD